MKEIFRLRSLAIKDPLLCRSYKEDAAAKLTVALRVMNLPPDAVELLRHFFGLDTDGPPPPFHTVEHLPCLDEPNKQRRLVVKLLWALFDPEALRWLAPEVWKA